MDRESLEDYEQKEKEEYNRLVIRRIEDGIFDFERERYPPKERFIKLQEPVALEAMGLKQFATPYESNIWAEIPFCGSLIIILIPYKKPEFEKLFFETSEIPAVIDFIKETGKLQVVFGVDVRTYEGLDYLDPFFEELHPPKLYGLPLLFFGDGEEIQKAANTFYTLAQVRFLEWYREAYKKESCYFAFDKIMEIKCSNYVLLKLARYAVAETIENLMIDDPEQSYWLLTLSRYFINDFAANLCFEQRNFPLQGIQAAQVLPEIYRPKIRFPHEIGKLLLKKLTYAPQGLRACNYLIDQYADYDLRKVQESLNEAIVTNHPDIVHKSTRELSEILDNVWNDKTIPRRVKGLRIGIPLSMAAIGGVAAGIIGAAGGFLSGLGFDVLSKSIDIGAEGLSEKIAKLRTKSYQANIYDFKQKYKSKIARP